MIDEAHAAYDTVKTGNGPTDEAVKLLADMVAMGTEIGLNPKQPNL